MTPGRLQLRNTIVANNTAQASPNCAGTIESLGYNLVFPGNDCGFAQPTDQVNQDPKLGPPQGNGDQTITHALGTGSKALDKGSPAPPGSGGNACEANDERGLPRTLDGDADGKAVCDIGAVEGGRWWPVNSTIDGNAASSQVCDRSRADYNCSLRGAISVANAAGAGIASVITLPATDTDNPYLLVLPGLREDDNDTGDLDVKLDITIVGAGASTTIIDGNGGILADPFSMPSQGRC